MRFLLPFCFCQTQKLIPKPTIRMTITISIFHFSDFFMATKWLLSIWRTSADEMSILTYYAKIFVFPRTKCCEYSLEVSLGIGYINSQGFIIDILTATMNGCLGNIGPKTKTVLWHKGNLRKLLRRNNISFSRSYSHANI